MSLGIEWTLESCYPTNSSELLAESRNCIRVLFWTAWNFRTILFYFPYGPILYTAESSCFSCCCSPSPTWDPTWVYVHCSHVWFGISNVNPGILQSLCTLQPCLIWNFPCQSWDPAEFMYIAAMFDLEFPMSILGSCRVYVHCKAMFDLDFSNVNPAILQSLCTLQPCLIWNFPCQSWDPTEFMYIAAMFDLVFPMSILGSCRVYVHCSHVWFGISHVNPGILQSLCT